MTFKSYALRLRVVTAADQEIGDEFDEDGGGRRRENFAIKSKSDGKTFDR